MKYSANKFNKSRKNNKIISITYNCYDTYCSARGNAIVKYSKIQDKDKIVIENFILKINHSLPYEEHVYIINKIVEEDLRNNKINIDMLEKITYARSYFINYIKLNPYLQITKIENDFIKNYNIKEISSRQNSNIKIPVKKVINSAHLHMKRINDLNNFSINNIRELIDYEVNQIVESLTSEYLKNNIIIKDDIYIILTNNMKKNLNEVKADNIFIDCTYKIIPPGLKNYKFLVVIGYNNNNKLVLYLFALIRHENIQNFESVFNYLKIKFNFRPDVITSDYQKGQIGAIIKCFPNSKIVLYWFHALQNIKKRIPFLKSKNITEKKMSKDLIANIKLMFFLPEDKIKGFYANIKQKFNSSSFLQFYKYLDKFLFRAYYGKLYLWNFDKLLSCDNIKENQYFVTNNFIERTNRALNENLLYKKSSFTNFRLSILDTDIYFENKLISNINNPNLSKAIIYYINNSGYMDKKNKKIKLINLEKLKEIYSTYVEIVQKNGLEMFDNIINEDYLIEETNYIDEEDDIIIDIKNNNNSRSGSDDDEDKDNNQDKIKDITKNKYNYNKEFFKSRESKSNNNKARKKKIIKETKKIYI